MVIALACEDTCNKAVSAAQCISVAGGQMTVDGASSTVAVGAKAGTPSVRCYLFVGLGSWCAQVCCQEGAARCSET